MSDELHKGLDGVLVDESRLSHVDGEAGQLIYRGYDIEDLAEHATFEEVVYLLWHEELPTEAAYERFASQMAEARELPTAVDDTLAELADRDESPMAALRTGVSMLSAYDAAASYTTAEREETLAKGVRIAAKVPTIIATFDRHRRGEAPIDPDPSLSFAADFLRMLTGEAPEDVASDVFDMALILHADHGLNASTFTSMVIASTMSDLYASVTGGIGALSGPLHGGANEEVMRMFRDIEDSGQEPVEWVEEMRERGDRVPGFGHRVYEVKDPRAKILQAEAERLAGQGGDETYLAYATAIEDHLATEGLPEKGIAPNVDFYSGIVYDLLGVPLDLYTPIFAMSRTAGWIGHVIEYQSDNRLIRPRARYIGERDREFEPLAQR